MPASASEAEVQPRVGASMIAHSNRPIPAIDSTAPTGSGLSAARLRDSGTRRQRRRDADDQQRHVDEEHRTPREPRQQQAAGERPSAIPTPIVPPQMPIARARSSAPGNTLSRVDRPAGSSSPRPRPSPPARRSALPPSPTARSERPGRERAEAGQQHPSAPDAIRQAARHQQQATERHRVGVDDPLETARGAWSLRTSVAEPR